MRELDTFTRAYIECALWSSYDYHGDDSEPTETLDASYDIDDIAPDTLATIIAECKDFQESNAELLKQSGLGDEQAGHDFWLTRNRHGAGFWDRGIGDIGRKLTDAAHFHGEVNLYVGDDGKVHV
jgi:hypothetical protein